MKTLTKILPVALAVVLLSCATIERNPRAAKGTAIGAAGGAASGAAIGAIAGGGKGAGKGAAIGAVVGAIGGGLVGAYMDKQARDLDAVLEEQDSLRREQERLQVVMPSDVLFESGQATIQPGGRDKLSDLAGVLNRYPQTMLRVVGHTDSRGSTELNEELSRRRAQAVADQLAAGGVSPARISIEGAGESRPVASNDTPSGRAQNRRVELTVSPDDSLRDEQTRRNDEEFEPR